MLEEIRGKDHINASVGDRRKIVCRRVIKSNILRHVIRRVGIQVDRKLFARDDLVDELAIAAGQIQDDRIGAHVTTEKIAAQNLPDPAFGSERVRLKPVTVKLRQICRLLNLQYGKFENISSGLDVAVNQRSHMLY